jgi:hypothetical protein
MPFTQLKLIFPRSCFGQGFSARSARKPATVSEKSPQLLHRRPWPASGTVTVSGRATGEIVREDCLKSLKLSASPAAAGDDA